MVKGLKIQAPFDKLKNNNDSADIALRKAVVLQAVLDATSNTKSLKAGKYKSEALEWLFGNSKDFLEICYQAGYKPEFIRCITRAMLKIKQSTITTEIILNTIEENITAIEENIMEVVL